MAALAFLLHLLSGASSGAADADRHIAAEMRVLAVNMMVFHQYAAGWAARHPASPDGPIDEAQIGLPLWYGKTSNWASAVAAGVVATWPAASVPGGLQGWLAAAMLDESENDYGIGFAEAGVFRSSTLGLLWPLPPGAPDGSAVYVSKVR